MTTAVAVKTAKDLQLNKDGVVEFKDVGQQLLWADSMIRSGMLPKSYKAPSEVVAAMAMAAEVGMKPGISTLRRTANINGTPSFYGELPLAIVQNSGQLAEFEAYYFDRKLKRISLENQNVAAEKFGFYCRIKLVNGTQYDDHYTIDEANKAGLGPVWRKHPEDMLKWRTIGKVLKTACPHILSGAPIAEYDFNTKVDFDTKDVDLSHMDAGTVDMSALDSIADTGEIEDAKVVVTKPVKEAVVEAAPVEAAQEKVAPEMPPVIESQPQVEEEIPLPEEPPADFSEAQEEAPSILSNQVDYSQWDLAKCGNYVLPMGDDVGKKLSSFSKDQLEKKEMGLSAFIKKQDEKGQPWDDKNAREMLAVFRRVIEIFSGKGI